MEDHVRNLIVTILNGLTILFALVFMFSVGLTLDRRELRKIFGREDEDNNNNSRRCCIFKRCNIVYPARVGLFAQLFFNPIICVLLCMCFVCLDTRMKVAAVLISCSPSGMASNLWVILSYGNTEISVVMTLITSTAAIVTVPFFFWLSHFILSTDSMGLPFFQLFGSVALIIGPLLVAVFLQRYIKSIKLKYYFRKFGLTLALLSVASATSVFFFDPYTVRAFVNAGWEPFVLGATLNIAGLLLGYTASRLGKLDVEYHRTIAFEVGSQNLAIPLGVFSLAFIDQPDLQAPYKAMIFIYAICSVITNVTLILILRYVFPLQHVIEKRRRLLEGEGEETPLNSNAVVVGMEKSIPEADFDEEAALPPSATILTSSESTGAPTVDTNADEKEYIEQQQEQEGYNIQQQQLKPQETAPAPHTTSLGGSEIVAFEESSPIIVDYNTTTSIGEDKNYLKGQEKEGNFVKEGGAIIQQQQQQQQQEEVPQTTAPTATFAGSESITGAVTFESSPPPPPPMEDYDSTTENEQYFLKEDLPKQQQQEEAPPSPPGSRLSATGLVPAISSEYPIGDTASEK